MTANDITNALTRAKCCLADMTHKLGLKQAQGIKDTCLENKTILLSMYIEALDNVLDCNSGEPANPSGNSCNLNALSGGYCYDSLSDTVYVIVAAGNAAAVPYTDYYFEYAFGPSSSGPWTVVTGYNTYYAIIPDVDGVTNTYLRIRMYCNVGDAGFREEIVDYRVYPPEFDAVTFGYWRSTFDPSNSVIDANWTVRDNDTITVSNLNTEFIISSFRVNGVTIASNVQSFTAVAGTDFVDGDIITIFFEYIGRGHPLPCFLYRLINVTVVPDPVIVPSPASAVMCPGGDVELSVTNYAYDTYLWSTGETTDTITVTDPGVYSVLVSSGSVTNLIDYQTITDDGINPQFIIYNNNTSAELASNAYRCDGGVSVLADIEIAELTGVSTVGATVSYYISAGEVVTGVAYPATSDLTSSGYGLYALITLSNGCTYQTPVYNEYVLNSVVHSNVFVGNCTCNGIADGSFVATPAQLTVGLATLVDIDFELYDSGLSLVDSSTGLAYGYTGLAAGSYTLEMTENWSNGTSCTLSTVSITVTEPAALVIGGTHIPQVCYDGVNSGSIDITISGGTGPYDVYFDTIEVLSNVSSPVNYPINTIIPDDTYPLSVVDANGCTYDHTVVVINPEEIGATYGTRVGVVDLLSISGGVAPYASAELYDSSFVSVGFFNTASLPASIGALTPGDYYILITDTNECVKSFGPITVS